MLKRTIVYLLAAVSCCITAGGENYSMEYCGNRTRLFANAREVSFADCLKDQTSRRPVFKLRDLIKQAYQGAYGAGHALLNREKAWNYFSREYDAVTASDVELYEIISPDYCRINMAAWKHAQLPKEWLFNMFLASSEIFPDSAKLFQTYLKAITRLYPETTAEVAEFIKQHRGEAVHHSREFVKTYRPSYRIVSTRFITMLPVLKAAAKLSGNSVKVIAIDGRSASGKTTLARQLSAVLKAQVIHMDDFFLPQNLRTPKRFAEPGGNVHYERFKVEVLPHLRQKSKFSYRKFDCSKMAPGEMQNVAPSRWRVVEGAYSLHPAFGNYADLKIFFDITPAEQMRRIRRRNGEEKAGIFAARWIPFEEKYINETDLKNRVDLIIH